MDVMKRLYRGAMKHEKAKEPVENSQVLPHQDVINCFRQSLSSPILISLLEKLVAGTSTVFHVTTRE